MPLVGHGGPSLPTVPGRPFPRAAFLSALSRPQATPTSHPDGCSSPARARTVFLLNRRASVLAPKHDLPGTPSPDPGTHRPGLGLHLSRPLFREAAGGAGASSWKACSEEASRRGSRRGLAPPGGSGGGCSGAVSETGGAGRGGGRRRRRRRCAQVLGALVVGRCEAARTAGGARRGMACIAGNTVGWRGLAHRIGDSSHCGRKAWEARTAWGHSTWDGVGWRGKARTAGWGGTAPGRRGRPCTAV